MPKQSLVPFMSVAIMLLMSFTSNAQQDSLNKERVSRHSVSISWGILSADQWAAINTEEAPNYRDLVDLPNKFSGAAFLTWRYAVADNLSLGVSIGLDNQTGRLSYGGPHSQYNGTLGDAGQYHREFYTVAFETRYCYKTGESNIYFMVGAGVTTGHVNYTIYPGAKHNFYQLYTPISRGDTHYNFQITPLGFTTHKRLAFSFEMGYGYKGMFCLGMNYHI